MLQFNPMNKISLIALDVDGTLLDAQGRLSDENLRAIQDAMRAGIRVSIASGRPRVAIQRWVRALNLNAPDISSGGAQIHDSQTGRDLFLSTLTLSEVKEVVEMGRETNSTIYVHRPDAIIGENTLEELERSRKLNDDIEIEDVQDLVAAVNFNPTKMLLLNRRRYPEMEQRVRSALNGRLQTTPADEFCLEVTRLDVDKGASLARLAAALEIPLNQVMAVGDAGNDVSMFRAAGLAVAMGNGMPAALQAADEIAPPNNESGVAWAIRRFALNGHNSAS